MRSWPAEDLTPAPYLTYTAGVQVWDAGTLDGVREVLNLRIPVVGPAEKAAADGDNDQDCLPGAIVQAGVLLFFPKPQLFEVVRAARSNCPGALYIPTRQRPCCAMGSDIYHCNVIYADETCGPRLQRAAARRRMRRCGAWPVPANSTHWSRRERGGREGRGRSATPRHLRIRTGLPAAGDGSRRREGRERARTGVS